MTTNHSPASPGSATAITSESPVRAPLANDVVWHTQALNIPIGNVAQIRTVPDARVDSVGGKLDRRA
jgi:hypothetical protein